MTVKPKTAAWNEAKKIFPAGYEKDEASSARAGYDIYRHPTLNCFCRICDLGCRLEVHTGEYGENITYIWVETKDQETDANEGKEASEMGNGNMNNPANRLKTVRHSGT